MANMARSIANLAGLTFHHLAKEMFEYLDFDDLLTIHLICSGHDVEIVSNLEHYIKNTLLRRLSVYEWVDLYYKASLNVVHEKIVRFMEDTVEDRLLARLNRRELIDCAKSFDGLIVHGRGTEIYGRVDQYVEAGLVNDGYTFTARESNNKIDCEFVNQFLDIFEHDCNHFVYIIDGKRSYSADELSQKLAYREYLIDTFFFIWKCPDDQPPSTVQLTIKDIRPTNYKSDLHEYDVGRIVHHWIRNFEGDTRPDITDLNLDCFLAARAVDQFRRTLQIAEAQGQTINIRYNPRKVDDTLRKFFFENANHEYVKFLPL